MGLSVKRQRFASQIPKSVSDAYRSLLDRSLLCDCDYKENQVAVMSFIFYPIRDAVKVDKK